MPVARRLTRLLAMRYQEDPGCGIALHTARGCERGAACPRGSTQGRERSRGPPHAEVRLVRRIIAGSPCVRYASNQSKAKQSARQGEARVGTHSPYSCSFQFVFLLVVLSDPNPSPEAQTFVRPRTSSWYPRPVPRPVPVTPPDMHTHYTSTPLAQPKKSHTRLLLLLWLF